MIMNKLALQATLHCLAGCSIGEIAGMMIGAHYGLGDIQTIALAVTLAFITGYALSIVPLLRNGMGAWQSLKLVFAADTVSITTMEIVDNLAMYYIPGAMDAHWTSLAFWASMGLALFVAFWAAYPVNAYLLSRGKGHALTHHHMHGHDHHKHIAE